MTITYFYTCLYNRRETQYIPAKVFHWRWGFAYDGKEVETASGFAQDYFSALANLIDSMGIWGAWKVELDNKENSDAH